ncbi:MULTISPECIES: alpha/beta fold hydrolase [unclassified Microbacterium]|uniref:alpha/beta fold hydrolase n=1 Tax=unclassified Microbacterium TaxID=2609290 RepID=UPI0037461566
MSDLPTVVLVHGAFADGASWSPVALRLQGASLDVRVPAISNRSLAEDAAYVRSFVEHLGRPVILVGHSYGATVVGVAGDADNVIGIVFVSGYALDKGETASELHRRFPDAEAVPYYEYEPFASLDGAAREEVSISIDEFPYMSALGLPADEAAVLAVSQRPISASVLTEPAEAAGWSTTPSWGIVASADRMVNPDAVRFGYERAGVRRVVEVRGPHLLMHTHPAEVAEVIFDVIDELS